jgi:hypothetical protein
MERIATWRSVRHWRAGAPASSQREGARLVAFEFIAVEPRYLHRVVEDS